MAPVDNEIHIIFAAAGSLELKVRIVAPVSVQYYQMLRPPHNSHMVRLVFAEE